MQLDRLTTHHSAPQDPVLKPGQFRLEIAGLRAIAVISVVLFHLKIPGFQGGFVGVDIFFVISGYLITRNILADARGGRFSFADFYIRRTRRIYPALVFTVAVTYIVGALWCSPPMFRELAKESTHALLSIANIQYWRQSFSYFAPNSDELALLHFWSLSAEEQFYLAWPILIVLAHRMNRTFEIIAAAGLASLVAATLVARSDSSAVFFLMPFRIYEFAIGALVLLVEKRLPLSTFAAEGVQAAGLAGTVASVLLFDSSMAHMEIAALLPCLGSAAMIWAGSAPRISAVLTNRFMVGIGAVSYSLYLCHWPIIFFARFHLRGRCEYAASDRRHDAADDRMRGRDVSSCRAPFHPASRQTVHKLSEICRGLRRHHTADGRGDACDIPVARLSVADAGGAGRTGAPAGFPRRARRSPNRRTASVRAGRRFLCHAISAGLVDIGRTRGDEVRRLRRLGLSDSGRSRDDVLPAAGMQGDPGRRDAALGPDERANHHRAEMEGLFRQRDRRSA